MLPKLFECTFILVFLAQYCQCVSHGYKRARVGQFPSTAAFVQPSNNKLVGGATIIHPSFVMGVKFSFQYTGYKLKVIAGDINHYANSTTPSRQERLVTHYFEQKFGRYRFYLIFRLDSPFKISKQVTALPLYRNVLKSNESIQIAGWGLPLEQKGKEFFSQYMYYVDGKIAMKKNCPYKTTDQGIWREFFCLTGATSPSIGMLDNGSPVYIGYRICGVASPLASQWNGIDSRRVAVIENLYEWIQKVIFWDGKRSRYDAIPIYGDDGRSLRNDARSTGSKIIILFGNYGLGLSLFILLCLININ